MEIVLTKLALAPVLKDGVRAQTLLHIVPQIVPYDHVPPGEHGQMYRPAPPPHTRLLSALIEEFATELQASVLVLMGLQEARVSEMHVPTTALVMESA